MKDTFTFRQFTIHQDRCAMKVGTDGVLLGAWSKGGKEILDIGTGTGLVALMMAQRCTGAKVTAIDIDDSAVKQAAENVQSSIFACRITLENISLQDYCANIALSRKFDCIVSNPPFFEDSLKCPDDQRTMARHTDSLPLSELFYCASQLLSEDGIMSIILPTHLLPKTERLAKDCGLHVNRLTHIRTASSKPPKRTLIELSKRPCDGSFSEDTQTLMEGTCRSTWFHELTKDFYL